MCRLSCCVWRLSGLGGVDIGVSSTEMAAGTTVFLVPEHAISVHLNHSELGFTVALTYCVLLLAHSCQSSFTFRARERKKRHNTASERCRTDWDSLILSSMSKFVVIHLLKLHWTCLSDCTMAACFVCMPMCQCRAR